MLILLIIYCIIMIFLVYQKVNYEHYQDKCKFKASGKKKKDCILKCSKENSCNPDSCFDICEKCDDHKKCEWLEPPSCKYVPKGNKVYDCVDECIGPRKIQWGGDACVYPECKRICESCNNEDDCKWLSKLKVVKKCKFTPWGPDKQACIDRCNSSDREQWGGDACDVNTCANICESCDKEEYCEWKKAQPPMLETPIIGLPPKQEIRVIPGNSTLLIQWTPKHSLDNPNISYLLYYFKSGNPMEGIKMKIINKTNCTFCEYLLDNLENDNTYSISLLAHNKLGKGPPSEIVEGKPMNNINLIYSEES